MDKVDVVHQQLADKFHGLADKLEAVIVPDTYVNMRYADIYPRGISNTDGDYDDDDIRMGYLDNGQGRYYLHSDPCGTVGCAAGWFAIALGAKIEWGDFRDGVTAVEENLGFDLQVWAGKNPDLWGNKFGGGLWIWEDAGYYAWGQDKSNDSGRFPPQVLVDQLRAVAGRIEARGRVVASIDWSKEGQAKMTDEQRRALGIKT